MRVGASARGHARIKKMWKEGVPPSVIAATLQMTPQSLEKIIANLEGREEKVLAVEENEEVKTLRMRNAELEARLIKMETGDSDEEEDIDEE